MSEHSIDNDSKELLLYTPTSEEALKNKDDSDSETEEKKDVEDKNGENSDSKTSVEDTVSDTKEKNKNGKEESSNGETEKDEIGKKSSDEVTKDNGNEVKRSLKETASKENLIKEESKKTKEEGNPEEKDSDVESKKEHFEKVQPHLSDLFNDYATFCDKYGSQGITFRNTYKWLRQAGVTGSPLSMTKADVERSFSSVAGGKDRLSCDELGMVIKLMAVDKLVPESEILERMFSAGQPDGMSVTDRLRKVFLSCW